MVGVVRAVAIVDFLPPLGRVLTELRDLDRTDNQLPRQPVTRVTEGVHHAGGNEHGAPNHRSAPLLVEQEHGHCRKRLEPPYDASASSAGETSREPGSSLRGRVGGQTISAVKGDAMLMHAVSRRVLPVFLIAVGFSGGAVAHAATSVSLCVPSKANTAVTSAGSTGKCASGSTAVARPSSSAAQQTLIDLDERIHAITDAP